jgi:3-oxoacyl-[acyl-carrier-protein] synthase III
MRLTAVEHALPSRRVTNEDVIRRVRERNRSRLASDELNALEHAIQRTLAAAGTEIRYYVDDGERPIDFALRASRLALTRAGISAQDIDFVIYSGVARGWLEPASAPALQAALDLRNATAFDVVDACAGWLRALHIAHSFLRGGTYRRGLIVNCECGFSRADVNWVFDSGEAIDDRVAAFTIGEAATATVVDDAAADDDFYFTFRTAGEHLSLCMIPLSDVDGFLPGGDASAGASGRFVSRSHALISTVAENIFALFNDRPLLRGTYDISFGHEVSEKACDAITRQLGVAESYFPTHRRYGNTVSASVPLGISTALREGRLKRGDRVLVIVGAAGITVGFAAFTY